MVKVMLTQCDFTLIHKCFSRHISKYKWIIDNLDKVRNSDEVIVEWEKTKVKRTSSSSI